VLLRTVSRDERIYRRGLDSWREAIKWRTEAPGRPRGVASAPVDRTKADAEAPLDIA